MVYENLFKDTNIEVLRLEEFLKSRINEKFSKFKKYNTRKKKHKTSSQLRMKIFKRFEESNRELSRKIKVDLKSYGY